MDFRHMHPRFHPISSLGLIASLIDGEFDYVNEQLMLYRECEKKPGSLDDATVKRIIALFSEKVFFGEYYTEQFARWKKQALTPSQKREIERLETEVAKIKPVVAAVLTLAENLKNMTFEAMMSMSDAEWGLMALRRIAGEYPEKQ